MTAQKYESKARLRRQELKEISQPLKPMVKDGLFETLNEAIIECLYKRDGHEVFRTFEAWKKDGFSIVKGSQAFVVWGRPQTMTKPEPKAEGEEEREFFPIAYLFSNKQVVKRGEVAAVVEEPAEVYTTNASEIQIKYNKQNSIAMPSAVHCSQDGYEALKPLYEEFIEHREAFNILLLGRSNNVLGFALISMGGITSTVVDVRIVFQIALKANATRIILSHNHPSGNLKPSDADLQLTRKMVQAGKILDIEVLDHIIITSNGFTSFADKGYM